MQYRDQQSRWVTYTGRRVGALQLSRADRLARLRASAQQRRGDTAPELQRRDSREHGDA